MSILAIETSCDDTCAAVVDGALVLSNVISSQADAHARFGGVVPEVASRHHLELVNPIVDAALADAGAELGDVESMAVTRGPGLIGALLVGVSTAKALAAAARMPLAGIDHLHGHVAANFLEPDPLEPPFLCLIASGGHTLLAGVTSHDSYEVLGQTLDDAAGEALDKGARLLGLGYPGGPAIQREAQNGDPEAFEFPIAMRDDPSLDFSFSGLKTALLYTVRDLGEERARELRADLAASYQAAVVDQLVVKLRRAARGGSKRRKLPGGGWRAVALGGGVAANSLLRDRVAGLCEREDLELKLVPLELCTDNAAMIASAARYVEAVPYPRYLDWDARA
ncbi:MAG TPA: tRNA (adenosine(37)-N6)-threonylcarbamoyltransferase complex transferase subunit TsaD [Solirubrobacterales bacterium]|nr:tRNA (adenosine(37)-N6)-threonylcarbamoyltransferase complex transferase subunit TsaD [Solirubrobacterales bacterium]